MSRIRRAAALVGIALLFVSACGSDSPDSADTTAPTTSATNAITPATSATASCAEPTASSATAGSELAGGYSVKAANGTVTLPSKPKRIVSLSPTATEMLFAIGAGKQVIAVDDQSNYPPEATAVKTDLSSYQPNVEAVAGYQPDLVVISRDANLQSQLESLGLDVWSGPAATTFDGAYGQIEQLGAKTGHVADAAKVVADMRTKLDALAKDVPATSTPLSVYHELDQTGYAAASNTFIGQVYEMFGLKNI